MKVTRAAAGGLYFRLATVIGDGLLGGRQPAALPLQQILDTPTGETRAVYVALGGDGEVLYVGSVCRATSGAVADRVREHIRTGKKAATWDRVWVFPLRADVSVHDVRQAEGRVATVLRRPPHNRAVPARPPVPPLQASG
jgi:hypothetical protein